MNLKKEAMLEEYTILQENHFWLKSDKCDFFKYDLL